jgi:ribonuclease P protein component
VLARSNRLTSPADFRAAFKSGTRAGSPQLVLHWAAEPGATTDARVGFVVSKAVGNAVTRNRVKRRLREIVRARLAAVPLGSLLVVRAQPKAALATYGELERTVDCLMNRLIEGAA